jgi:hypothetical protein
MSKTFARATANTHLLASVFGQCQPNATRVCAHILVVLKNWHFSLVLLQFPHIIIIYDLAQQHIVPEYRFDFNSRQETCEIFGLQTLFLRHLPTSPIIV